MYFENYEYDKFLTCARYKREILLILKERIIKIYNEKLFGTRSAEEFIQITETNMKKIFNCFPLKKSQQIIIWNIGYLTFQVHILLK